MVYKLKAIKACSECNFSRNSHAEARLQRFLAIKSMFSTAQKKGFKEGMPLELSVHVVSALI